MRLVVAGLALITLACGLNPAASSADTLADLRDTLIVLNKSGHNASFIDVATGEVRLTLPTGGGPHEIAVSPDGRRAVVADYGTAGSGGWQDGHTLTVFDLGTGTVAATIDLRENAQPHGLQFTADGERLAVTIESQKALIVVDVTTGEIVQHVRTDADASHMVVLAPDQPLAFVANIGSGTVSVIDLEEGRLVKTIRTGAGCEGIDITPDGSQVWTTNRAADTLSVIDTRRLEVVGEINCGDFPIRIKFTPDGARAVVSCLVSSEVAVYDVKSRKELARVTLALDVVDDSGQRLFGDAMAKNPAPVGVLIDPAGLRAYIAATNADTVVTLDLESYEVVGGFAAGREPDGLGWARMAPGS